jgi:hypothetical protein
MLNSLREDDIAQRIAVLQQGPLVRDFRESDLRLLAESARPSTYRAGMELYRQSDVDNALYVIVSGTVSLFHVDPAGVETFVGFRTTGPDGWLGEASVLLSDPHDVTVVAYTDVEVLEIERKDLDKLLDETPGLRGRLKPKPENADRLHAPRFGWQSPDESVVKFVREHQWALVRRMVIPVGLLIALGVVFAIFSSAIPFLANVALVGGMFLIALLGFYLFIDWHDDFYVVTNKRVVHVDQIPGIRQKLEEAPLSTIQEIQFARNSILAHLLDFGDLRVETFAGSVAMKDIPQPEDVKSLIFREIEKVRSRARAAARKAIRDELQRRVGQPIHAPAPAAAAGPAEVVRPASSFLSFIGGALRYFFPKLREESGDSIIYRKHWVALLRKSRLPFTGLIFTAVATLIWYRRGFLLGLLPDAFWVVWLVMLVVFFAWSLWIFEDWRNDLYIVTSTRIIDIQRIPFLLQETRKESGLDKIQTMEVKVLTPLARFFRYGDVIIRVPGAAYEFKDVFRPNAVQAEISRRLDQFKRRQAENEARGRRAELSDWFAVYEQIKSGYQMPGQASETSE